MFFAFFVYCLIVALLDADGIISLRGEFGAWGGAVHDDDPCDVHQAFRLWFQAYGWSSFLFWNRYRYYDGLQVRFLSLVAFVLVGGCILYACPVNPVFCVVLFVFVCAVVAVVGGWDELDDFGAWGLLCVTYYGVFGFGFGVADPFFRFVGFFGVFAFDEVFVGWLAEWLGFADGVIVSVFGLFVMCCFDVGLCHCAMLVVSAFSLAVGVVVLPFPSAADCSDICGVSVFLELLYLMKALLAVGSLGCSIDVASIFFCYYADCFFVVNCFSLFLHR
ncbi:hypothetical protein [Escherichia coli]|uniref:hypothetical protein n=1 Tax=Escherichia coli TaxID=562 RepID=UPI00033EE286|nr:hypothetical protein [Escherichia coli]EOX00670.1 hypothetical protein WGC_01136 [Escherichia coli KTE41]